MPDRIDDDGLRYRVVTKKETALRQIRVALQQLNAEEYEAAITLAGAAEGMLETGGFPTPVFENLKQARPADFETQQKWIFFLNETLYWLKHNNDQDTRAIGEFEAWLMLT